ncbi:class I SAM-dependent methyltransferase [Halalkalibacter sp. AB-rgal2]|uniref:class I SAM-dependent methyltransferase n=1 Tax=Halalkalibacter sp. AB-rgal2 TaxID=3242695 RepID=UPI00359EB064
MEKGKDFYNNAYQNGGYKNMYRKHYSTSPYFKVWNKAIEIIKTIDNPAMIEIGCGVGQFAQMLFDHHYTQYKGIDFSDTAISLAQTRNPLFQKNFSIDDAYTSSIYEEHYNLVILFEVLEHLQQDLPVLANIKKGVKVIFSVPNFDSASHVRHFQSKEHVFERYRNELHINQIHPIKISTRNTIYLGDGQKR